MVFEVRERNCVHLCGSEHFLASRAGVQLRASRRAAASPTFLANQSRALFIVFFLALLDQYSFLYPFLHAAHLIKVLHCVQLSPACGRSALAFLIAERSNIAHPMHLP